MTVKPHCITAADIAKAAEILQNHAIRTPVMTSRQADEIAGAQLFSSARISSALGPLNSVVPITPSANWLRPSARPE